MIEWKKEPHREVGYCGGAAVGAIFYGIHRMRWRAWVTKNLNPVEDTEATPGELARRWPEVIARIAEWERLVRIASKRGGASFFSAPNDGRGARQGRNIAERVLWSTTSYGGRQFNLLEDLPTPRCSSFYQLCE